MSFGGFFGGGSSSDKNNNSNTSSSSSSSSPSGFSGPLSSSSSSSSAGGSETLQKLQAAVAEQANVQNARILISKVNEVCFANCITNPGSSLSGAENKCLNACMEKYFDAWNVTSRVFTNRVQRESLAAGAVGGGKELF
ncbi:hypothetical protein A1O1_00648 [Capronia coronata CBS 617.96]|uniref:Mitochondrial import inner membrane translocase subunit n=1 Tax=Capronia coronata CBS 617.96 TaxID=1182541 RepID=W9Z1S6_9EURO|nr:uncharacterized protein A1O1_00648 [Capronia coronata CBS 617.96]EXJ95526.1 hypothetical protein A1O1_00648 [Capronia coronata CBS 617.96]